MKKHKSKVMGVVPISVIGPHHINFAYVHCWLNFSFNPHNEIHSYLFKIFSIFMITTLLLHIVHQYMLLPNKSSIW
jgi:hypothetical protein